jgi:4-amino-4-deoxy-L-arabinose transferase-like glycosyltransferase
MLHVSLFIELLRSRPRVTFWFVTLAQAFVWWLLPSLFYSAPPGELADILALGREFQLGTWRGPPLAYWMAEIAFRIAGMPGVYLLSQACVVLAYWAVFLLARAVVGIHHAVIAVTLMIGVSAMTLPTPEFGPSVMAMPLTALAVLHFWRAVGEGRRSSWFLLAVTIGLLLLTTYAGLILVAVLLVILLASARGRATLRTVEPWMAGIVVIVTLLPHIIWIDAGGGEGLLAGVLGRWRDIDPAADAVRWLRMLALLALAHAGLLVLVVLSAGWWMRKPDTAPNFTRGVVGPFAHRLVYLVATIPALVATLVAVLAGERVSVGALAPYLMMSGLATVVAAGPVIAVHRQRTVGFAWTLLLLLPPAAMIAAIVTLPWVASVELKVSMPANDMGRFFAESFERRTGRPLAVVAGEPQLAAVVAVGAPSRPSVYDYLRPDRTPWVTEADILANGAIVLWSAADTAGAPPPEIRARFPGIVPELPRAFDRVIQGRLPLTRIGWGMIRPRAAP